MILAKIQTLRCKWCTFVDTHENSSNSILFCHLFDFDLKTSWIFGQDISFHATIFCACGDYFVGPQRLSLYSLPKLKRLCEFFCLDATSFEALPQHHDRGEISSSAKHPIQMDLYSLENIFFEMCHLPFSTGMERVEQLATLRSM